MNFRNRKGFTLIELLVVVAIISLLSSVILASLNSARAKTRDARRISDLRQLQLAIEMKGSAPGDGNHSASSLNCELNASPTPRLWTAVFDTAFQDSYMKQLPVDPKGTSDSHYCYHYINFPTDANYTNYKCVFSDNSIVEPDGWNDSNTKVGNGYQYLITFSGETNLSSKYATLYFGSSSANRYCILGQSK